MISLSRISFITRLTEEGVVTTPSLDFASKAPDPDDIDSSG